MKTKKIFILLPDGVGLRNFAFTSFVHLGEQMEWDVIFWNQTSFDLTALGYREIKQEVKARAFTDLLKRAKIDSELDYFQKKFNDPVYQTYKFPAANAGVKQRLKNLLVALISKQHRGDKGLQKLRKKLKDSERNSKFYRDCKKVLRKEKPDFVFCTNQRPVNAIAPLTAAEDLGIKTVTFIFSWDNLPKATMIVEPHFYFVWSKFMKQELLKYYPFIKKEQVFITGTPQFEPHFDETLRTSREIFFSNYNLDLKKEYICFSGDDSTTSPYDPHYLNDLAEAVVKLNESENYNLGIIFRRCPVDFSDRYLHVLEKHAGLITPIAPEWTQLGDNWNLILPTKEDLKILVNTIFHSKTVVNLGSSMVFDFAIFNKPCLFIRYNVSQENDKNWSVKKVYDFVHFRSMPTGNEVIWIGSKEDIVKKLEKVLQGSPEIVRQAKQWFQTINTSPAEKASERIWFTLKNLLKE